MLTGIDIKHAIEKAKAGKEVFVVDRNIVDSAGNTPMVPFMNYLQGLDFLVDVPAVENPDFKVAVQDMIEKHNPPAGEVDPPQEEKVTPPPHSKLPGVKEVAPAVKRGAGRKKTEYDAGILKNYVESGLSNDEIASMMGVSRATVMRWVRENDLSGSRRRGGKTKEKEAKKVDPPEVKEIIPGYNADRHQCKTCRFRSRANDVVAKKFGCNYIEVVGHSRGCSVEDCNVYECGEPADLRKMS